MRRLLCAAAGAAALLGAQVQAAPKPAPKRTSSPPEAPAHYKALAHEILEQFIDTDTTHAHGSSGLARLIAERALAAGYAPADVQVLAPADHPTKGNVVIRLRGKGLGKPLLAIGHLDVVEANREDWTVDPFRLTEKDGYFYGRGTQDMKGDDALVLTEAIRLKQEGYVPDRDIIFAFTADEEAGGDANGVQWLFAHHRELVDAGFSINQDGDGAELKDGALLFFGVETSEKLYVTFELETTNRGGHSSIPRADNAIYQMTQGLDRLQAFSFPARTTATTRAFFAAYARLQAGQTRTDMLKVANGELDPAAVNRLSADPLINAVLHTTCVTTVIQGGQGESALPERVHATVQCRVMPGETPEQIRDTLAKVLADPGIKLSMDGPIDPSPETTPSPQVLARYRQAVEAFYPDPLVVPDMQVGASDSVYTREAGLPSYVASTLAIDLDDHREHGRDERIRVSAFDRGVAYVDRLMKIMSARD
ncbi:MAG: M20/M25/M40 family metallo-hydrolase [Caulobacteraceae bacterium]